MLERLRKALFQDKAQPAAAPVVPAPGALAQWAARQGYSFQAKHEGRYFSVQLQAGSNPWRLESGPPTRDFIHGAELRGRNELGLAGEVSVMVLNRALKDALEHRAFAEYTDSLQTQANPNLPEEMRWLAMYDEARLPDTPMGFADMYAVLADNPAHAKAWVTAGLATEVMRWPEPVNEQTPMVLMAFRGNVYMRLEYPQDNLAVLEHACRTFALACLTARHGLPRG